MIASRLSLVPRNAMQVAIRNSGHGHGTPYTGQNLPFGIKNWRVFVIGTTTFFAIPFALPFIMVRYQLRKQFLAGGD